MKCSRRKAPMGTTPLKEWRRRSRNEVPSPARNGATPAWILGTGRGATVLAVDATMIAPNLRFQKLKLSKLKLKLMIIVFRRKGSQGDVFLYHRRNARKASPR